VGQVEQGERVGRAERLEEPEQPGPPPDFAAYVRLALAAERGLFDFVLCTAGPRPYGGAPGEGASGEAADGPEPFTVLNALAAVTDRIGLAAAVSTAGRDPYILARRTAALDRLSAGRAAGPVLDAAGGLAVPESPSGGRPVAIEDDGEGRVVVSVTSGRTPLGVKVLARIRFTVAENGREAAGRPSSPGLLTGSPRALADLLEAGVRSGEVDGYVLLPEPALAGRGLDGFVDRVVPLLQQRGSLRSAYRGATLRDHLGLP
jgi:alkanesulfonate monooxygenase SsuD/methylene tetrahydromethanopterin reductase-like flavin-dependent oxidoreductase (luciferase family)